MPYTRDEIEQIEEQEAAGLAAPTCLTCGKQYPPTKEYWFFRGKERGTLCRDCTRKEASEQSLLNVPSELLSRIVGGEIIESSGVSHLRDEVRLQFGGVKGIAAQLKFDYDASKPGSNARVQLMKAILQLEAEADKSRRAKGNLGDLDPDDLLRVLEQVFGVQPKALEGLLGDHQGRTG